MNKIRGFERISEEQFKKDFAITDYIVINLPKRATTGSAGYDVYAPMDIYIAPGEDVKVPTGIKAYMQNGEVLKVYPRSGLGFKYFARLANTVGIIDKDYYFADNDGHIFVKLRNEGDKNLVIKRGDAMCQAIFEQFLLADGDDFNSGEVRTGGFGSTNKS